MVSPYVLHKKKKLNSRDHVAIQQGALIKISDGENWGVADVCPKPEFGDLDLKSEIKNNGSLFLRALELAEEDLEARRMQRTLLKNKNIKNNFLITDYKADDLNKVQYQKNTIKIKADRDIQGLSHIINNLKGEVKIRLDFNSILSVEEYDSFLSLLTLGSKKKIEYIEDPTLCGSELTEDQWKKWNLVIPLAFDFQKREYNSDFATYRIFKPSRQKIEKKSKNYTLTSAMEHPVGLAHALRIAQDFAQNDSGFLTLDLYEENDFTKYFEQMQNLLNFSKLALDDFGIGMTDELNRLKWVLL